MAELNRNSLLTLEAYAKARPEFRRQVIEHKKVRSVHLGDHLRLLFEDELTVRYQIQEMLRIERIFEEDGITHELETYRPLIPGGRDFKATMLLEYPDADIRKVELTKLIGIEDQTWIRIDGFARVYAIADEDLDRENDDKTSSVHFLRFELADDMAAALKRGANLAIGVDHPNYRVELTPIPQAIRNSLVSDLA
jgi:Protein of unknown function (DUF3501)